MILKTHGQTTRDFVGVQQPVDTDKNTPDQIAMWPDVQKFIGYHVAFTKKVHADQELAVPSGLYTVAVSAYDSISCEEECVIARDLHRVTSIVTKRDREAGKGPIWMFVGPREGDGDWVD